MFVFWDVKHIPNNERARSRAIRVLSKMAGVTSIAEGSHNEQGEFQVTLYYMATTPNTRNVREGLRRQVENALRPVFGKKVEAREEPPKRR